MAHRFATPIVTYALLIACALTFLLQLQLGDDVAVTGALWPLGPQFHLWQLVSYAFLHGDIMHLAFNAFGLYLFGRDVERMIGARRFIALYTTSVLAAAAAQLAVGVVTGSPWPTVGASGGLFGVMLVFALLFPRATIVLLFRPIPMPAWLFVTLYAIAELWMGVTGTMQGVAHFAHLGGLVGGAWMWAHWRMQRQRMRGPLD